MSFTLMSINGRRSSRNENALSELRLSEIDFNA